MWNQRTDSQQCETISNNVKPYLNQNVYET